MSFPFFFKKHFSVLAKQPAKQLASATKQKEKAIDKIAKTGMTENTMTFVKQAVQKEKIAKDDIQKAGIQAFAKASVPTILQAAIKAYCSSHGVTYDPTLATDIAGNVAGIPATKWKSVARGKEKTFGKDDYAIKSYLSRLSMKRQAEGKCQPVAEAPEWAASDIRDRIAARAIPLPRGAEYAEEAFMEAFYEVRMPEYLDGVTIDDMLEGNGGPF